MVSRALAFQLTLQLTLHVDAADDQSTEQLADLCADVRIGPRMLGRLTTPPQALPIRATTWGQESSVGLSIDLDLVRLEALEAARREVTFSCRSWCTRA